MSAPTGKAAMRGYPPNVKVERKGDAEGKPHYYLPTIVVIEKISELEHCQTKPEPVFMEYAYTDNGLGDTLRGARSWLEEEPDRADYIIMIHKPFDVYSLQTTSELQKHNVEIPSDDRSVN